MIPHWLNQMNPMIPYIAAFALAFLVVIALTGCSYTSSWRQTQLGRSLSASTDPALVSLSFAQRKAGQRRAFFNQVQAVLEDLPKHDGLLGYAFRFQIVGDKAWTITAWRDAAARDQFVHGAVHGEAMRQADAVMVRSAFSSLQVPIRDLPPSWATVTEKLPATKPATP